MIGPILAIALLAPMPGSVFGNVSPTTPAARAALTSAPGFAAANGAAEARVWACQRRVCGVRLLRDDAPDVDALMFLTPELHRKRRRGRWVGQWRKTGRLAVTRIEPLSPTERTIP